MLAAALEAEVTPFLGRARHERGTPFRGYRNGHLPARELTGGVRAPRRCGWPGWPRCPGTWRLRDEYVAELRTWAGGFHNS